MNRYDMSGKDVSLSGTHWKYSIQCILPMNTCFSHMYADYVACYKDMCAELKDKLDRGDNVVSANIYPVPPEHFMTGRSHWWDGTLRTEG